MAGFVAHDITQQFLQQWLGGHLLHVPESSQSQTFDHDLHTQVGHVPATVIDNVVKQHP